MLSIPSVLLAYSLTKRKFKENLKIQGIVRLFLE